MYIFRLIAKEESTVAFGVRYVVYGLASLVSSAIIGHLYEITKDYMYVSIQK